MAKKIRRYDLDWLRVLVFGLLILYHVGMFFVPWGWHIKNNVIYDDLRWPMLFLNQWRLPILFVISGMGTYYALSSRTLKAFNWERFTRLIIPLVVGMLLIVPPQIYIERIANGQFAGPYWQYFPAKAFIGVYPEGNLSWHHLWFLPYLFLFSVVLSPIFIKVKRGEWTLTKWLKKPYQLYFLVLPLYFVEAFVEPFFPVTLALIGDWFTISFYIILFFYGFLLLSSGNHFWTLLDQVKKPALFVGIISFSLLLIIQQYEDTIYRHFTEAMIKVVNLWSWILAIMGYAAKYLNKKSEALSYANRAVYPFYILHQTITIIAAYYMMNWDQGLLVKFGVLTLATFGGSWLIYHFLILKIPLIHPLFGLKKGYSSGANSTSKPSSSGVKGI